MNEFVANFVKTAQAAGLSDAEIKAFIESNSDSFPHEKTAEQKADEVYTYILSSTGLDKSAQTIGYVDGFLESAIAKGASIESAIELTKQALEKSAQEAAVANDPAYIAYAEGFVANAKQAGFTDEQAVELLQKSAAGGVFGGVMNAAKTAPKAAGKGGFGNYVAKPNPTTTGMMAPYGDIPAMSGREKALLAALGLTGTAGVGAYALSGDSEDQSSPALPLPTKTETYNDIPATPPSNPGAPAPVAPPSPAKEGDLMKQIQQMLAKNPEAFAGLGGGLAGGAMGYGLTSDENEEDALRNTLGGAAAGAGGSALLAYLLKQDQGAQA